jgi:hypothetical protein
VDKELVGEWFGCNTARAEYKYRDLALQIE